MKYIKKFNESFFGFDIIKTLSPVYKSIEKEKSPFKIKRKLIEALEEYKDYILELVGDSHNRELEIDNDVRRIEEELNSDITRELNLHLFFRTIGNIVSIPKKKGLLKIETKFEDYYDSLEERIQRCIVTIEKGTGTEHEGDEVDDDTSVLNRGEYTEELRELQVELNKLSEWVAESNKKLVILFEGRDSAGKGSTIKRFTNYMNPKHYKIVTKGVPTKEEMVGPKWFERYSKDIEPGKITMFDRSYYGMALVNPVMGYASEEQYNYFMDNVNKFEEELIEDGVILIKLWFSITKEKQLHRFELRKNSPLKYWKYSPNDEKSIDKWDKFTDYKEVCFSKTSTDTCPWVVVQAMDKRLSQINSIRYVLSKIDYDGKDNNIVGEVYPEMVYEIN